MIIHQLIAHHLSHRDDAEFYRLQARDAIQWIERCGVKIGSGVRALDLGCGHGVFGVELQRRRCEVVFADESNWLEPGIDPARFRPFNIEREPLAALGRHDLVICSNVLEHLAGPDRFLASIRDLLAPGGHFYLSWTNWLSPWGGHEFSPFHFLGSRSGHRVFDKLTGKPRKHTPFVNLFPTYIGRVLKTIRRQSGLRVLAAAPRYYPELAFLVRLPVLREFLTWNCALLIGATDGQPAVRSK